MNVNAKCTYKGSKPDKAEIVCYNITRVYGLLKRSIPAFSTPIPIPRGIVVSTFYDFMRVCCFGFEGVLSKKAFNIVIEKDRLFSK